MFKFKNNTFYVTRGDGGKITFSYKDGSNLPNTDFIFRVYEKNGFDSAPLINESAPTNGETSVTLELFSEHTSLGSIENEIVEYWYEMKLGPENTILGFDESGAKIFYLYPSGKDN